MWEECIEKRVGIFEIGKRGQVFVTQIARERAIEGLPIRRRKIRCDGRKVIEQIVPIPRLAVYYPGYRKWIGIKRRSRSVRRRMWQRRVHAKPWGAARAKKHAREQ